MLLKYTTKKYIDKIRKENSQRKNKPHKIKDPFKLNKSLELNIASFRLLFGESNDVKIHEFNLVKAIRTKPV